MTHAGPAHLIRLADQIDHRLGPISGRDADQLALVLREAAKQWSDAIAALENLFENARPVNWNDDEDPDQAKAWCFAHFVVGKARGVPASVDIAKSADA